MTVASAPVFSIVTPVHDPPLDALEAMVGSVLSQTFSGWELILVDDASTDPAVVRYLRGQAAADSRVRVVERASNGHIVVASNDGVRDARGEFIALLDHDDALEPHALQVMWEAICRHDDVDYLYSDEDKVRDGGTYDAFAKPDWSPERLRAHMYTSHLSVLRTSLVREVGGFHTGFEGSQDHDLVLRVTERSRRVVHVPQVLYHWRVVAGSTAETGDAKPYAWDAGVRAVQAHLDRVGIAGVVRRGTWQGTYRIDRALDPGARVSVVIPTRGSSALVWGQRRCLVTEAVRSLLEHAGHRDLEIVVVHDDSTPASVLDDLATMDVPHLVLRRYSQPFSFSEKCNIGAAAASGEYLLFLNDDVEIISDDFVPTLCAPLSEAGVGMTGAKLYFSDTTIQHAGLALYGRHYRHEYHRHDGTSPGAFAELGVNREVSGLTAACIAMRRSVFFDVGGFSEQLPVNFNDVDLSLKVRHRDLRLLWMAHAEAYHFESLTRVPVVQPWEATFVVDRWGALPPDRYLRRRSRPAR